MAENKSLSLDKWGFTYISSPILQPITFGEYFSFIMVVEHGDHSL